MAKTPEVFSICGCDDPEGLVRLYGAAFGFWILDSW